MFYCSMKKVKEQAISYNSLCYKKCCFLKTTKIKKESILQKNAEFCIIKQRLKQQIVVSERGDAMGLWAILKGEEPNWLERLLNYKNAGQFGEYTLEYALKNGRLKGESRILKNIYVPYKQGDSEIDLILLHEKGIFVFESKNYKGWIFGEEKEYEWTQIVNKKKHHFRNPIAQNETHIKALAEFLQLPQNYFTSYVVFSQRSVLKSVPAGTQQRVVLRSGKMLASLRKSLKKRASLLTKRQIQEIDAKLKLECSETLQRKQEHIEYVQQLRKRHTCPQCGSPLVKRKGKYGEFWGCRGFPDCRFTKDIGQEELQGDAD